MKEEVKFKMVFDPISGKITVKKVDTNRRPRDDR